MRRVFWPKSADQPGPSIAVGWKNGNDFVVTALLPHLEVYLAEKVLQKDHLFKDTKSPKELYKRFNGDRLKVLGTVNHIQSGCDFTATTKPLSITFPGQESLIILYDPPNAHWLSCLSVQPIKLELTDFDQSTIISKEHEQELLAKNSHTALLKEKIKQHTTPHDRRNVLDTCISQINCSHELNSMLVSNAEQLFPKLKQEQQMTRARRLSLSARSFSLEAQRASTGLLSRLLPLVIWAVIAVRALCDRILGLLAIEIYGTSLLHLSATCQQIDLNLRRLCYFPEQLLVVRKRRHIWFTPEYNEEYIRFYQSLWLGFNDRVLGWLVGSLILSSSTEILEFIEYLRQDVLGKAALDQISWIMSWPGGLKLHTEITVFFGGVIVWTLTAWQDLCRAAMPLVRGVVLVSGYLGAFGGVTLQIAILCDLISVLTIPFYNFYVSFAKLYRNTLRLFLSLFRLFRGKKYNVLRKRVDSENYDMSQLFLGTILFTVLLFLLPTILVFYVAFTLYRIAVVTSLALLEMLLTFFNHFPLFLLLLRAKSPGRIPGGIMLEPHGNMLEMKSIPLSLGRIFHQYNMVAHKFGKHFFSAKVVGGLLTGRVVTIQRTKLYVILYSSLPKEQKSVGQLYESLCQDLL